MGVKGRDTAFRTVWKGLLGNGPHPRTWAGSSGWELGLAGWHKQSSPELWPRGRVLPPQGIRCWSIWGCAEFKSQAPHWGCSLVYYANMLGEIKDQDKVFHNPRALSCSARTRSHVGSPDLASCPPEWPVLRPGLSEQWGSAAPFSHCLASPHLCAWPLLGS